MGKQYHFVVVYDEESNSFSMDYDTQEVKFQNAPIYNKGTDEWEELTSDNFQNAEGIYSRAAVAIGDVVNKYLGGWIFGKDENRRF